MSAAPSPFTVYAEEHTAVETANPAESEETKNNEEQDQKELLQNPMEINQNPETTFPEKAESSDTPEEVIDAADDAAAASPEPSPDSETESVEERPEDPDALTEDPLREELSDSPTDESDPTQLPDVLPEESDQEDPLAEQDALTKSPDREGLPTEQSETPLPETLPDEQNEPAKEHPVYIPASSSSATPVIAMFGDSYTSGTGGQGYTVPLALSEYLGVTCDNYGVGGIGWLRTSKARNYQTAYTVISGTDLSQYNTFILCYGINDSKLGDDVLGSWDSTDETTVVGMMRKALDYLVEQKPNSRIIIVAPYQRYDSDRALMRATFRLVAEDYGFDYIDQDDCPYNMDTMCELSYDGFGGHPSKEGYVAIGKWLSPKIRSLLNIKPDISNAAVRFNSEYVYTGKAVKPTPAVTLSVDGNSMNLSEGTDYTISYSNNKKIGTASAKLKGTGQYTGTCTAGFKIVADAPADVTIKPTSQNLNVGESKKLAAEISPHDVSDQTLRWSSTDPSVASVNQKGLVTAKHCGKAQITASSSNGITAACNVRVLYKDVNDSGKSYFNAVYWAVGKNITFCEKWFHPEREVTRGELVAFLWRMAGKPSAKGTVRFSDVNKNTQFYKAIQWALQKNIIKGYPDKTFRPKQAVTRSEAAAILWRYAGRPSASSSKSPFTDIRKSKTESYKAILWGAEKEIIKGFNGQFMSNRKCSRGQTVTFLYRYGNTKE